MKRKLVALLALLAALAFCASAAGHPLGNFTINRYSRIEPSGNRIYVLYVLDMAEILTFQARSDVASEGKTRYAAALARRIAGGLHLSANGRLLGLRELHHELAFPPGQAGLETTRLELLLSTPPLTSGRPARISYRDANYAGRLGWKEIVVHGSAGARVFS